MKTSVSRRRARSAVLAEALPDRRIALEGHLEGPRAEALPGRADALRGVGEAGAHVGIGKAEGVVAHGEKGYPLRQPGWA